MREIRASGAVPRWNMRGSPATRRPPDTVLTPSSNTTTLLDMKNRLEWQETSSKSTGVAGINFVRKMITEDWGSRWQEISPENDDGVDGLAMIRKTRTENGVRLTADTGVIAFVQVKCGPGYLSRITDTHVEINLGKEYIDKHRSRWARHPGPVVIVYVLENKAWWGNVRDADVLSPTNRAVLRIPKGNMFGPHSKGNIRDLDKRARDNLLPVVTITEQEQRLVMNGIDGPNKQSARRFFQNCLVSHAKLGAISFSRTGWRHTTRKGRSPLRIQQSFLLMPAATKIIAQVENYSHLRTLAQSEALFVDLVGIRARAEFPHRDTCVVQVVLLRKRDLSVTPVRTTVWFYTVYEPRRLAAGGRAQT